MIEIFIGSACVILTYFTLLFIWGYHARNYAVADIGWGFGFVIITTFYAYTTHTDSNVFWLTACLVYMWGFRLTIHIYFRNRGKPEDFRYRQLREKWKQHPLIQAYIKLFVSQACIMLVVSICIFIAAASNNEIGITVLIGGFLAALGLLYESISDYQLSVFKRNTSNHGKIMRQGLWRFSRHPNYFGEVVFWWGLSFMIAASTGNWLALVSGLVMNLLIVFVSGVPMLEEKYKNNPSYADYVRSTNSLIPKF